MSRLLSCKKIIVKTELPTCRKVRVQCRAPIDMETRVCTVCGGIYGSSVRRKSPPTPEEMRQMREALSRLSVGS